MKRLLTIAFIFAALVSGGTPHPVSAAQGCDEIGVIGFEIIEQGDCSRLEIAVGCGRQETGYCFIEVCNSGFTTGCIVY